MKGGRFPSYQQFQRELLGHGMGALSSTVEDIADDIYRVQVAEEPEMLWDPVDDDDE